MMFGNMILSLLLKHEFLSLLLLKNDNSKYNVFTDYNSD